VCQKWSSQSYHSWYGLNFRTVFYLVSISPNCMYNSLWTHFFTFSHLQLSTVHCMTSELSEWFLRLLEHFFCHMRSNFLSQQHCTYASLLWLLWNVAASQQLFTSSSLWLWCLWTGLNLNRWFTRGMPFLVTRIELSEIWQLIRTFHHWFMTRGNGNQWFRVDSPGWKALELSKHSLSLNQEF